MIYNPLVDVGLHTEACRPVDASRLSLLQKHMVVLLRNLKGTKKWEFLLSTCLPGDNSAMDSYFKLFRINLRAIHFHLSGLRNLVCSQEFSTPLDGPKIQLILRGLQWSAVCPGSCSCLTLSVSELSRICVVAATRFIRVKRLDDCGILRISTPI